MKMYTRLVFGTAPDALIRGASLFRSVLKERFHYVTIIYHYCIYIIRYRVYKTVILILISAECSTVILILISIECAVQ